MRSTAAAFLTALFSAWPLASSGEPILEADASDTEIRIGNVMPYTGPLAAFGAIGRAEAAYFDMINELGGINGRKVRFVSYDDSSNPADREELTRRLVESDKVQFVFGAFGTLGNLAARQYLNERKIPQLFVASGDDEWARPKSFPWTMGWPPFRLEGRIYANYIQASYPGQKIGVLWQNDEFGRDLFRGLEEGLGDSAGMIVSDITFNLSDTSINTQIGLLRSAGAEIVVFDGAPAIAALAIRQMANIDWHPVFLLANASASIANALRPAGLENSIGVISTSFLKDTGDPVWKNDSSVKEFLSFMDKYYPEGDKEAVEAVFGYAAAETLTEVLKRCDGDLSPENIMRQSESLKNFQSSMALPGILLNTSPVDFRPIEQMRLVQFDGHSWQPIGDVIDSAFLGAINDPK